MTIKQHFKEFLQKEGAYEKFCEELFNDHCDILIHDMEIVVGGGFEFPLRERKYWENLDDKWRNHLKTIEQ